MHQNNCEQIEHPQTKTRYALSKVYGAYLVVVLGPSIKNLLTANYQFQLHFFLINTSLLIRVDISIQCVTFFNDFQKTFACQIYGQTMFLILRYKKYSTLFYAIIDLDALIIYLLLFFGMVFSKTYYKALNSKPCP